MIAWIAVIIVALVAAVGVAYRRFPTFFRAHW